MSSQPLEKKCQRVLEVTRQRVRADAQRAPEAWRLFFDELEKRIFDFDIKVDKIRKRFVLQGRDHTDTFSDAFGCGVKVYLTRQRIDTAFRLRGIAGLPVWRLARIAGFGSTESLNAALRRQGELVVARWRETARPATSRVRKKRRAATETVSLRHLLAGGGDGQEASEAAKRIETLDDLGSGVSDREALDRRWVVAWWDLARRRPMTEWRLPAAASQLKTPVLFEHLCRQSREEGRDDRHRGVKVAELAFAAIEPLHASLTKRELDELYAAGWARLGHARRLALDYEGAEEAFAAAEGFLVTGEPPAELRAELLYYRGGLRSYQHRFAEALELTEQAVAALGSTGDGRLKTELLLARGHICRHLGENERALADNFAALDVLDTEQQPYLGFVAYHNLAVTLWQAGRLAEAEEWSARTRPLAAKLGQQTPVCHTLWLEGLIADRLGDANRAAARLQATCEAHRAMAKWGYFAVAALDLANVETRRGETRSAVRWVAEALPYLEALRLDKEGLFACAMTARSFAGR